MRPNGTKHPQRPLSRRSILGNPHVGYVDGGPAVMWEIPYTSGNMYADRHRYRTSRGDTDRANPTGRWTWMNKGGGKGDHVRALEPSIYYVDLTGNYTTGE